MSEQDGTQTSTNKRKSRQASKQNGQHVLSAFLYEHARQWLSTPSAGEPAFWVLDNKLQ